MMMDQSGLKLFVTLANRIALKFNKGETGTCILTSYAIVYVLRDRGLDARPLRVECAVYPDSREHCGTILGCHQYQWGRKAKPGMWRGHLVRWPGRETPA